MCSSPKAPTPLQQGTKQPRILLPRSYLDNNLSIGSYGGNVGGRNSGSGNVGVALTESPFVRSGLQLGKL